MDGDIAVCYRIHEELMETVIFTKMLASSIKIAMLMLASSE
jgi:hypothetical protein